jgi:phosphoribosylamine--glycine ligase
LGTTVQEAQRRAYELAKRIHWDGVYYRGDIGYRAIRREQDKG